MKTLFLILLILSAITLSPNLVRAQDEYEIKVGEETITIKKYYMCFLKKGPNIDMDSSIIAYIQKEHLAYVSELKKEGKILFTGHFGDNKNLQGISIFNVTSKEEAIILASKDPAVKSGRLKFEIREWWSEK